MNNGNIIGGKHH